MQKTIARPVQVLCALLLLSALSQPTLAARKGGKAIAYERDLIPGKGFFTSTYKARRDRPTLIRSARILTGTGDDLERTDLLILNGLVARVGSDLKAPRDARIIEAEGKWVTPGLVDLGFSFTRSGTGAIERALEPENTSPQTGTDIEWPLPALDQYRAEQIRALTGGVTTMLYSRPISPRTAISATDNLALGLVLRNVPNSDLLGTLFADTSPALILRCPNTGAGWQQMHHLWRQATNYLGGQYLESNQDLNLIAAALRTDVPLYANCSTSDALTLSLAFAKGQKIKYRALLQASEAYKQANSLAATGICAAFSVGQREDQQNNGQVNVLAAPLMDAARRRNGCAIVQSGGPEDFGQLHLLTGRASAQALALGLEVPPARAIAWITSNPAKVLGISEQVGMIQQGRPADLVIWSGNPFSAYTRSEQVFVDGALIWDLQAGGRQFELDAELESSVVEIEQEPPPEPPVSTPQTRFGDGLYPEQEAPPPSERLPERPLPEDSGQDARNRGF